MLNKMKSGFDGKKKLAALSAVFLAALVFLVSPALALWDLTGTYTIVYTCTFGCSGDYPHTMMVTSMDLETGDFSGDGYYNPIPAYTWVVTGNVSDSTIEYTVEYTDLNPGYTVDVTGAIAGDGSMSGTASSSSGQTFTWVTTSGMATYIDGYIHGGGHILQDPTEEGSKRKNWYDISFGGSAFDYGDSTFGGEWEVNFHHVSVPGMDKTKFHSTSIDEMNFFEGPTDTCHTAMNMTVTGEWDGEPGYTVIFRAGDIGPPGEWDEDSDIFDTVRVQLFAPSGDSKYDSHQDSVPGGDFEDQSSCVGLARTGLDTGNLTIWQD